MCGIFAYTGKNKDASHLVLKGLKKLEYRGYDSWGIAALKNDALLVEKHTGKIKDAQISLPTSKIAIGHTRWATHGGVTVANAHPHFDCQKKIVLLHNGIVENFEDIKHSLDVDHNFKSQTDTEVIVHLIEENMHTMKFSDAVRYAFLKLKGLNAIVVLEKESGDIIACKNGSPLVVGIGEDELYLASDPTGIIEYTKRLVFLKDQEMVILNETCELYSIQTGKKISFQPEVVDWEVTTSSLGKFPHYMIKEIFDQESIIKNMSKTLSSEVKDVAQSIQKAQGTFFIGAGTAYHACLMGTYLFSTIAGKHVNTAVASEFNYLEDFLTNRSLIIALSQSGETIDVIEPLQRAQKRGTGIIGIVNSLGSTIYRMSDKKILLSAGPELAVASTKAYTAKVSMLLLLAGIMSNKLSQIQTSLLHASDEVKRLLEPSSLKDIKKIAKMLSHAEHIYTIGRGLSYPTALEAALKIKEVSYIHTEGLAGGELKHGTIALISKGIPCIVFAPEDETYEAIISNATEIKARGGVIIGVSSRRSSVFDYYIEVKDCKEASAISHIIPAQLIAYYLAVEKNLDPDKPRNLAKSVTVK
ncbi:MAG: hypothetical protein QG600_332 [Patescibacteria group bacterium]|jgi:glucosamine--fructose-6-phosphate aminotransferase (isomerizing)|nr:hypothetical protein [Patescibacteria group bacterium]